MSTSENDLLQDRGDWLRTRDEQLHDCLRNLAHSLPRRTDGPVLWAEHLRQAKSWTSVSEPLVQQLLAVSSRGLPHTSEGLGYLAEQLDEVLRFSFFPRRRHTDREMESLLELIRLRERLARALAHFRSGGLFAVYAGPRGSISPDLVLPHPR